MSGVVYPAIIILCILVFILSLVNQIRMDTPNKDKQFEEDYKKLKDWADLLSKYNELNYISPDVKVRDAEIDKIMDRYRG